MSDYQISTGLKIFTSQRKPNCCNKYISWYCCLNIGKFFLKLINNSSSLNKGNHDRDGVWISGARFSKAPETFRARKAKANSRTLRVESCFIYIF